jgi:hypothetical protein
MSEVLELTATETTLGTAEKRALVERELRENPQRSDRKIAEAIGHGICHKTVGAARERLGIAIPLPIASPPVSPSACPPPPGVVDEPKYDPFDPKSEELVIPHQPAIAVYENTSGAVVIIQCTSDPDQDDPIILVRPEHVEKLVARLRKVAKEAVGS